MEGGVFTFCPGYHLPRSRVSVPLTRQPKNLHSIFNIVSSYSHNSFLPLYSHFEIEFDKFAYLSNKSNSQSIHFGSNTISNP